ncbi:T9SS type A sorting domain-containing protein [Coprobacter fastidiosus]|uniref:T9SS type A sorting domain-containing protein n=1 Tax=Coprobacter fastidiosus TaxID=1099853 RepID=UPI0034640909
MVVESTQKIEKAEIYSLSGNLITSEKLSGQNTREEIYVNNLNPDIYIIRVVSGGKTYSQKIMIR